VFSPAGGATGAYSSSRSTGQRFTARFIRLARTILEIAHRSRLQRLSFDSNFFLSSLPGRAAEFELPHAAPLTDLLALVRVLDVSLLALSEELGCLAVLHSSALAFHVPFFFQYIWCSFIYQMFLVHWHSQKKHL